MNYENRGKSGTRLLSNLKPLEESFGYYKAVDLQGTDLDRFIKHALVHGRRKTSTKPAVYASIRIAACNCFPRATDWPRQMAS